MRQKVTQESNDKHTLGKLQYTFKGFGRKNGRDIQIALVFD